MNNNILFPWMDYTTLIKEDIFVEKIECMLMYLF